MNKLLWLGAVCGAAVVTSSCSSPPPPPPVSYQVPTVLSSPPPPETAQVVYNYDQKPLPQQPMLISPQDAQAIVDRFRTNYPKLGSPRILIYVNRQLVNDQGGLKLTGRSESYETSQTGAASGTNAPAGAGPSERTTVRNDYSNQPNAPAPLADRQTARDVERLCGRPFRLAGVSLVDQQVAAEMIGDQPLQDLTSSAPGTEAEKQREAVSKIADVVIEVLIGSRNVVVPQVSGDQTYAEPDIQATAIQLKDSKIIGQASSWDVLNHTPGYTAHNFTVQDITEATALALMDDIMQGIQAAQ